jgi:phosphotriesterase-related protein
MRPTTVLGDIEPADLGLVLPHEHLVANATAQWIPPDDITQLEESLQPLTFERLGRSQLEPVFYRSVLMLEDALAVVHELRQFAQLGGRTVVDLSPIGFGRDPTALRAISRLTGLNVIMGCGEYREIAHSAYVRGASVEQIADVMVRDLTEGVGSTGIRAGIIGEIGSGNPVTEQERKVLRAAARAQLATGTALNIHRTVYPDPNACLVALDLVLSEGVDPGRVVMSHCDERPDASTALEIGRRGAFIECDTFGMERWMADWSQEGRSVARSLDRDRIDIVKAIVDAGFIDRLLVSQDVCMQTQLTRHGGWGYAHITRSIEERLGVAGLDARDIQLIRVRNPRSLLCGGD